MNFAWFLSPPFLALVALSVLCLILWQRYRSLKRKLAARTQRTAPVTSSSQNADRDLQGQVAIVTGGGTGLGRCMSLELARRGAKVVVASRSAEHLDSVVSEIRSAGGEAMSIPFDVRNVEQVEGMVKQVVDRFGRIDMLVNNAAGNFLLPAEKLTTNGWNAVIGIVLNGTWYCTSAVSKQMIKQRSGAILNIVANYAWSGQPGVVHSCSAKAGVLAMTRTLAVEWARYGIRTNAFAPGAMITDGASSNLKFDSAETQERIRKLIPVQRFTSAEEMAKLAVFLLTPQADYINGEVLTADGGAWLPRGFLELGDFPEAG